jgi:putative sigma-54 modulation protein
MPAFPPAAGDRSVGLAYESCMICVSFRRMADAYIEEGLNLTGVQQGRRPMRTGISIASKQDNEHLQQVAQRRIALAVDRFGDRVRELSLKLEDINGPRGGIDQQCTIRITGDFGTRFVRVRDASSEAAIDRALDRAARVVSRSLDRLRSGRRSAAGLVGVT